MAAVAFNIRLFPVENTVRVGVSAQNVYNEPPESEAEIRRLEDPDYRLRQPLTIRFSRAQFGYEASFDKANFAVSGVTKGDAYQALETELLDAFDDWTADESALGPGPLRQLAVLRQYIEKC